MESVEEIKQPGRPQNAALRAAFPATVPVLTGYLCLGMAYGLLMSASGYGPLWAVFMSILVFGGSIQYVAVTLLTAAFAPVQAFLIFALTDETFSLVSTLEPPKDVERRDFYFWISLLNYSYWVCGSLLGGILGSLLTFDTTGMDFALTALFVVLFLEQWKKRENRAAGLIGMACAAVSLAVFGADNLVIPAMALILAALLGGRRLNCI